MTAKPPELTHDCELSLFVACYNEESNILAAIGNVVSAANEVGCTYDIVVFDGSVR